MSEAALQRWLGSCAIGIARPEHTAFRRELFTRVANADMHELLPEAERHGISPLVALHSRELERLPADVQRALTGLAARHTLAHRARTQALEAAFEALDSAAIRFLVLKGAALAHLVYPRPELRPMRDVDLLVADPDLARADAALHAAGFASYARAREGRHEVVTRSKTHNGFAISLDLHRRLGVLTLPLYAAARRQTLDELWDDSQPVAVGGRTARTLSREDLLRFVFRHGFGLQLDEDRLRFVAIADAVTAMEVWVDDLDWAKLRELDEGAYRGLAMLHHVVPLSTRVLEALDYRPRRAPFGIATQYWGWPLVQRPKRGDASAWFFATLFPSEWWLRTRHGGTRAIGLASSWRAHLRELSAISWRVWTGAPRPER